MPALQLGHLLQLERDQEAVKYVIVDVDGTVALRGDRSPFDWDRVSEDLPNLPVIEVVKAMAAAGYALVFVSGRMGQCRELTAEWIKRHVGEENVFLLMRQDDDYRSDDIVKREIYETKIFPFHGRPAAVFDDRNSVVAMWRSLGLLCLHVCDAETGNR